MRHYRHYLLGRPFELPIDHASLVWIKNCKNVKGMLSRWLRHLCLHHIRARKLYTFARIYEWKFGKGEWKLPFASPTGRVDLFGFVIIFEEKKELTSMFYSLQKQRKHSEKRSFGRFKMSLKCDRMFMLVSSKCNLVKSG